MPVTLRRHLATVKLNGQRKVPLKARIAGIHAGRNLKQRFHIRGIKSASSEVERAVLAAETGRVGLGLKRGGPVKLSKEIGWKGFFVDEKKAMSTIDKQYEGNELKARNAWLAGDTMGGSLHHPNFIAENIIKRRFGLALAAEAGKAGFGSKAKQFKFVMHDNVTHSWIVESVVQRLTKGMKGAPKMVGLPKETSGITMFFVRVPGGKYRVKMSYEELSGGDVTKNFAECMLPSVRKYLDV